VSTTIDIVLFSMDTNEQLNYVIDRIKELRKQKSISLLELSIRSDLSQSFLGSVERGEKKPSVETLLRIASALEVSPKCFFPENEDKPRDEVKDAIISLVRSL